MKKIMFTTLAVLGIALGGIGVVASSYAASTTSHGNSPGYGGDGYA